MVSIKLKAVGDIMLGDHPVCLGHGVRSKIEQYGFDYIFDDVQAFLKDSDILFGNLETVLSDIGYDENSIVNSELRGRKHYTGSLSDIGFNVMSIANNHIAQHGSAPFFDTIRSLTENGIFPSGVFSSDLENYYVYKKEGLQIALLSYSMRPEKYYDGPPLYSINSEDGIVEDIKKVRDQNDVVIVSLHWGEEYVNLPSRVQIETAHKIIDSGAKLILGHHPHVLQGGRRI